MSEAKFTKGDWMRGNCESYGINGEPFRNVWSQPGQDAQLICRCFGEQCDENAQLIAASKKMLAALKLAEEELTFDDERGVVLGTNEPRIVDKALSAVRAAIALAQGS